MYKCPYWLIFHPEGQAYAHWENDAHVCPLVGSKSG
jgi:hypothetical protein